MPALLINDVRHDGLSDLGSVREEVLKAPGDAVRVKRNPATSATAVWRNNTY